MTAVFFLFLRRLLLAKRTLFFAAIAFIPIGPAIVFRAHPPRNVDAMRLLREFLAPLSLLVPAVLLPMFFGTTAFGEEVEGKTIPYLLTRPRARRSFLLAKTGAVVVAAALLLVPGFLAAAAILRGADAFAEAEALAVGRAVSGVLLLASLAYGTAFILLGLAVPHPVIWGLLLSFGWEGFVGALPGQLKAFTIMRYLQALLARACGLSGKIFEGLPLEESPPGAVSAVLVLVALAAAFTFASERVLRRRDFAV